MCRVYVRVAALSARLSRASIGAPYLDILVDWNDNPTRTFADIQHLTNAVVEHLDTERYDAS